MKDKQTFPDNPDVWLKDLASLMNLRLDDVPAAANDAVFEGKSPGVYVCICVCVCVWLGRAGMGRASCMNAR